MYFLHGGTMVANAITI